MEKQIIKWLNMGYITSEVAELLLADVKESSAKRYQVQIQIAFYVIGIVLLGFGVFSFISANDWVLDIFYAHPLLKVVLLTLLTFGIFVGGYIIAYVKQNYIKLGRALIFFSCILIWAVYVLLGQIFHLYGDEAALSLTLVSILPVAYVFRDKAVNILSIICFVLLLFVCSGSSADSVFVVVPMLFGGVLYLAGNLLKKSYPEFSNAYKIVGLFSVYFLFLSLTCWAGTSYHSVLISDYVVLSVLFLLNSAFLLKKDKASFEFVEYGFSSVLILFALLIISFPAVSSLAVMIISNIFVILLIALGYRYAYKGENVRFMLLSNIFLILYIVTIYCRYAWSFMDKTLFFICGGVILVSLGLFLERKKKQLVKKAGR